MHARILALALCTAMASGCRNSTIPTGVDNKSESAAALALSISEMRAEIGVPAVLPIHATDGAGRALSPDQIDWIVADTQVASVEDGVLYAWRPGTTVVTASVAGISASMTVITWGDVEVTDLVITPDSVVMPEGGRTSLTAHVTYSSGARASIRTYATWESTDTTVAVVSNGEVSARSVGATRIIARFRNGTASAAVVVSNTGVGDVGGGSDTLPPPAKGDVTVDLLRFDGAGGPVVVSNGVPLRPGTLRSGEAGQVRLVVDGTERSIAVTELAGRHRDGSLRSVLIQVRLPLEPEQALKGRLIFGSQRAEAYTMEAQPISAVPSAVILPTAPDYLISTDLVGPTIPVTQSRALGSSFSRYESDFVRYADQHWAKMGSAWGENYYDRVLIYYAWWVRTGDPEYWRRATELAVAYRRDYLEANNYGTSPHQSQLEGLEKHYLLTGDEASRSAVAGAADILYRGYHRRNFLGNVGADNHENRIQARVLQAELLAWRLETRGDQAGEWAPHLDDALNKILSTQQPDGAYRFAHTCGESLNYMTGMLNDVLASYYTYYRADSRILEAVQRAVDWLWMTQWVPESQAFKYISAPCPGVGVGGPAADLNLMFVTGPSWVYRQTDDARYRDMADQIFAGGVGHGNLTGTKQFNENYYASFKYLGYR